MNEICCHVQHFTLRKQRFVVPWKFLKRDLDGAQTATGCLSNSRQVRTSTTSTLTVGILPPPPPLLYPLYPYSNVARTLPLSFGFSLPSLFVFCTNPHSPSLQPPHPTKLASSILFYVAFATLGRNHQVLISRTR